MRRRTFLKGALGAGAYLALPRHEIPAAALAEFPEWIACGDVSSHRAVVTSRAHANGQMWLEWSTHADFRNARKIQGSLASQASDWTGRTQLDGLPDGQRIFVRSHFTGQDRAPVQGQFLTPPSHSGQPVRFVWGGDVAGADYVSVNISSPNTSNLRTLQDDRALDGLLGALAERRTRWPRSRARAETEARRQTSGANLRQDRTRPEPRAGQDDLRRAATPRHGRRRGHQHHHQPDRPAPSGAMRR